MIKCLLTKGMEIKLLQAKCQSMTPEKNDSRQNDSNKMTPDKMTPDKMTQTK